jgi:hypothetical protein
MRVEARCSKVDLPSHSFLTAVLFWKQENGVCIDTGGLAPASSIKTLLEKGKKPSVYGKPRTTAITSAEEYSDFAGPAKHGLSSFKRHPKARAALSSFLPMKRWPCLTPKSTAYESTDMGVSF